jgi:zinc D-Ala-D-Ala carboxypeptidase
MRTLKLIVVGLIVVIAASIGAFVTRSEPSSAHSPGGRGLIPRSVLPAPRLEVPRGGIAESDGAVPDGGIAESDGALPDGATAFDDEYPGIANLDPDLLNALRAATKEADDDGVELSIKSGWRSPDYQNQLLRDAVAEYGSEKEAARWVATADTSPHVSGDAVDIGSANGVSWLSKHGVEYGLCQIYRNEPWHYELRRVAAGDGCPRMYADPTRDPRMRG